MENITREEILENIRKEENKTKIDKLYDEAIYLLQDSTTLAKEIDNLFEQVISANGELSLNEDNNKTISILKMIIKHSNTSDQLFYCVICYLENLEVDIKETFYEIVDEMNKNNTKMDIIFLKSVVYADKYVTSRLLDKIVDKTNNAEVLLSVTYNKNTSAETLDKIADKTNDADVLISVSDNSKTSSETLNKIVDKIDYINNIDDIYVLLSAKKNKNISKETFERIMKILTKNLIKEVSLALYKIVLVFAVISYFYYNIYTLTAFICTIYFYFLSKMKAVKLLFHN